MLELMGAEEVRCEEGGTERAEDYIFFCGEENGYHQLGTGFVVHKKIVSAVRRVEFISDRMSYIILRGHWCNVIVLNGHVACEGKSDVKDKLYEELGRVLDKFPRHDMNISLDDFNAKIGKECIFKPKKLERGCTQTY
jgi:hypothetical protein